jgi:hypothetical protein
MMLLHRLKLGVLCALVLTAFAQLCAADGLMAINLRLIVMPSAGQARQVDLSRDDLLALPKRTVTTMTPWTEGLVEVEGVSLAELIRASGAKPSQIKATALNNYAVEIPASDAGIADVIVAYRKNGAFMSVRDKGPLWLIYPLTSQPELDTEATHSKMIWQLSSLELR